MKRILLIAERDFFFVQKWKSEQKVPAVQTLDAVWCYLISLSEPETNERFYCRRSSLIIKQFKMHDFRTRIKFDDIAWETMQRLKKNLASSVFSSNETILKFRQLIKAFKKLKTKNIIENAKYLIFPPWEQMSSSIFSAFLARLNLYSSTVKPVASSNWKFTFANSGDSLSNSKLFHERELCSNWFSRFFVCFKRRPFHQN